MASAVHEKTNWQGLEHYQVNSRFEITEFLQSMGNHAFFRVRANDEPTDLLLRMEDAGNPLSPSHLDRFLEATFLNHPNLLRVVTAGQTEREGKRFNYLVTEMAEMDLTDAIQQRHLSLDEIADLARQLAAGLKYLHSENFVYCALRQNSIWRVGAHWKLSDFSEMRLSGQYPLAETRKLLLRPDFDCPPEANDGEVSEEWDVWSLASVLRKLLLQIGRPAEMKAGPARTGGSANISIPAPYDRILCECLNPDLALRADLDTVTALLANPAVPNVGKPLLRVDQPVTDPLPDSTEVAAELAAPTAAVPKIIQLPQITQGHLRSRTGVRAAVLGSFAVIVVACALFAIRVYPSRAVPPVPAAAQPAPVPAVHDVNPERRPSPFGNEPATSASVATGPQRAISAVLNRWVSATRNRDLEAEISCYAPMVDRFYGQRAVSINRLRDQEQDVFARIGNVRKFEVSNVRFKQIGPQWAVVVFDKTWDFGNHGSFAGAAREEMVLRPVHGQWKISGQQEVKVYWVKKASSTDRELPGVPRRAGA